MIYHDGNFPFKWNDNNDLTILFPDNDNDLTINYAEDNLTINSNMVTINNLIINDQFNIKNLFTISNDDNNNYCSQGYKNGGYVWEVDKIVEDNSIILYGIGLGIQGNEENPIFYT